MGFWRFLDYRTDDHRPRNLIQEWYGDQQLEVQAEFDATVTTLAAIEDWEGTKSFKVLKGKHIGLSELRFSVTARKHGKLVIRRFRPVGIWREEAREFVFLIGCEKSRGVYTPANAFGLALTFKTKLENGEGETCDHY